MFSVFVFSVLLFSVVVRVVYGFWDGFLMDFEVEVVVEVVEVGGDDDESDITNQE